MKHEHIKKRLEMAGYKLDRTGEHSIFKKRNGRRLVLIPNHGIVNEETAKSIFKAAGL